MTALRVGNGIDIHAFGLGDHVMLGGVRIPYHQGVIAHSDGDVLLHALCDALLGAAGLGDIGEHFPDSDLRFKNISSVQLLSVTMNLIREQGFRVVNADMTVLAEAPKVNPHKHAMRRQIAECLAVEIECINIKATTTEKLGFIGRAEGIVAQAVVLLSRE